MPRKELGKMRVAKAKPRPRPKKVTASGRRRTRRSVVIRTMRRQPKKSHLKVGRVMPKL